MQYNRILTKKIILYSFLIKKEQIQCEYYKL